MDRRRKDYSEAVKMYAEGYSIADVAFAHGVTRQSMHKVLRRRGVELRPNLRYGKDNHFYRGGSASDDEAQNVLELAIKRGQIVRPGRCEKCGSVDSFRDGRSAIQGHHTDYNKPLDVMWLCQKCHHEWHKHNKSIARRRDVE